MDVYDRILRHEAISVLHKTVPTNARDIGKRPTKDEEEVTGVEQTPIFCAFYMLLTSQICLHKVVAVFAA